MRSFQALWLTTALLTTTACASNSPKPPAAPLQAELRPASAPVSNAHLGAVPPEPSPALPRSQHAATFASAAPGANDVAATQDPGESDPDNAEAIYGQAPVRDPWEGFNRKMHGFNKAADRFVLRPLAVGYDKITPAPVQACVSRFFGNLRAPVTAVNQVLQGRLGHAAQSLGRFAVNTTVGIGGLFDPAARFGMARHDGEDFGQTLAIWGWRDSRYLVLPLIGPGTVRDAVSILGDQPLSPIGHIQSSSVADKLQIWEVVDGRTQLLPMDKFLQDAFDDYLFLRDAWAQRRAHEIRQGLPEPLQ